MPSATNEHELFFAGRLSKPMSELLRKNNEGPRLTWELENLEHVIQVDRAHAVMLSESGLLTSRDASAIIGVLESIKATGAKQFVVEPGAGSIVLQIERKLAEHVGSDVAGRLVIARSRLDQGATVWRMSQRVHVQHVAKALLSLEETLTDVAENYRDVPSITHTHLQQAQPATFGHYLLAFRDRLQDAFQILTQLYARIDRCPLGAVGLSGTDLDIDRHRTQDLLGFSEILENSRLGRDGYYQIEIASALALIMTYLNDLATDLHIGSSIEFGTIELDDSHTSTSSIFPQKKNPYALETIKGKAADALGWVTSAFATFRSEGSGDTGPRSVYQLELACGKTAEMLQLMSEVVDSMTVNEWRFEQLLDDAWVTTNRLGNALLTRYGMSYRNAHSVVARLVKNCLDQRVSKTKVTMDMLNNAAEEMGAPSIQMPQEELKLLLDHRDYIQSSRSLGGVGPFEFDRLLQEAKRQNLEDRGWLVDLKTMVAEAGRKLDAACTALHASVRDEKVVQNGH